MCGVTKPQSVKKKLSSGYAITYFFAVQEPKSQGRPSLWKTSRPSSLVYALQVDLISEAVSVKRDALSNDSELK